MVNIIYQILFSIIIIIVYYILNNIFKDIFINTNKEEEKKNKNKDNNLNNENKDNKDNKLKYNDIKWSNELLFYLNGVKIILINPNPTELLVTYIRDKVGLKGTKLGCEEGGCGACTIVLSKPEENTISVNSCLRPLCANDGYSITTIEGIGSIDSGLSCEQSNIVEEHGTQCGFCTPGWITNMHALNMSINETNPEYKPTGREIDAYFDGNICRCTGYKPILKAFKKNCSPEDCLKCPHVGTSSCPDLISIEDIVSPNSISPKSICNSSSDKKKLQHQKKHNELKILLKNYTPLPLHFYGHNNTHWYRPVNLSQLCSILSQYSSSSSPSSSNIIQLVGGNTSIGVTKYLNNTAPYNKEDFYNIFIDINLIPELTTQVYDTNTKKLCIGASITLSELINSLNKYADKQINYNQDVVDESKINHHSIFSVTAHHLRRIANTQVRNAGTWAGNLGIFNKHSSFPSDVVLSFTTANAILSLCDFDGNIKTITMEEFINMNSLNQYLILNVTFQESSTYSSVTPNTPHTVAETFKICIREHNAHAQLNAGFNLMIVHDKLYQMLGPLCQSARIVYGGVSAKTFIAHRAEQVLINSRITSNTLQRALSALQLDLEEVGLSTSYGDNLYRQSVMQSCLYRSLLRTYLRNDIPANVISAINPFIKPQSRGTELYTEVKNKEPIRLPVPKLEAKAQTTGEAIYPSDEPLPPQGLCAAIVYTTQCACILSNIDPSPALSINGVVAFFGAKDIPGVNSLSIGTPLYLPIGEEVLTIGSPVGIIVATSDEIANIAASLVKLTYTNNGKIPITNLSQAISQKSFYDLPPMPGVTLIKVGDPETILESSPRRVKGTLLASGQSHFYMEAQSSVANIIDGDILEVTCGTQDLTTFQNQIINVLNVTASQVHVKCSRTGGAFGGKLTGGIIEAVSSALASRLVKRPVRIFNTRTADMYIHSGREGYSISYEIGFDNDGKILALIYDIYCDAGCAYQDSVGGVAMAMRWADNAYYFPNYLARATLCFTNTPPRTYARAPGLVQSCLATSVVIERVASELGINEEYVKSLNFLQDGLKSIGGQVITNSTLNRCWDTLLRRSFYNQRLLSIQEYNKNNLWRKKGISIEPVKYGIGYAYYNAGCQIGIYKSDGSIVVCHNGVEMGQGINTKVSQVVSAELGVDISFIRVTTSSTSRIANGGTTGGSGTSEVCCQAAIKACHKINAYLLPYKKKHPKASWIELLSSLSPDVPLNAEGWYSPESNPNGEEFQYYVWGACVSEIEYDVLSGMVNVLSSEIIYDNGLSINPYVDLGQIEGAFVMGLGYMLQERIDYDSNGLLESIGTWEYKPPLAQDIPSIFNVTLLSGAPNKGGILRSKAVGEPSIVLANSIYFATKMAIQSSRLDAGNNQYFDINAPLTIDIRQTSSLVSSTRFIMPK